MYKKLLEKAFTMTGKYSTKYSWPTIKSLNSNGNETKSGTLLEKKSTTIKQTKIAGKQQKVHFESRFEKYNAHD